MKEKKERIAGGFNEESATAIKEYAKLIDRSMADTIRIIVENFLKKEGLLKKYKSQNNEQN